MCELDQVSQATLDRMVDGELTESEQQSLLIRLGETEDGWRRLALSYVEAQAWGTHLRSRAEAPLREASAAAPGLTVRSESALDPSASPKRRVLVPGWLTVALTAAVTLVAGLLGGMELRRNSARVDSTDVATTDSGSQTDLPAGKHPVEKPDMKNNGFPITPEEPEFVELVLTSPPGNVQAVSLPIHTSGDPDRILNESDPVLSPRMREYLRERGHEVVEQRRLIPIELPDGRQVVIPVRQVQFRNMVNHLSQ